MDARENMASETGVGKGSNGMSRSLEQMVENAFMGSLSVVRELAQSQSLKLDLVKATEMMVASYEKGGCVFAAGNGGSAADAQHFVAELVSKLAKDRTPIRAFAMTVDTSILTAIGNDYGYDLVFERQVRGLMKKDDVLFAITTSGNSKNILGGLKACREIGAKSILLTGKEGGMARGLADHVIIAPGGITNKIQECHLIIYHTLCELLEAELVKRNICQYV